MSWFLAHRMARVCKCLIHHSSASPLCKTYWVRLPRALNFGIVVECCCRYTAGPTVVVCRRVSKAFTSHGGRGSMAHEGFCWMLRLLNAPSFVRSASGNMAKSFWWPTSMRNPATGLQRFGLKRMAWYWRRRGAEQDQFLWSQFHPAIDCPREPSFLAGWPDHEKMGNT